MELNVNGIRREVPPEWEDESLLWVLREPLALCGTKFGCGQGQCGACTVLVDGTPQRACLLPVAAVGASRVTTVEALATGGTLHPVQQAWIAEQVTQCGYCEPGFIMAIAALLQASPKPSEEAIAALPNICRCGSYPRIRRAIAHAAAGIAPDKAAVSPTNRFIPLSSAESQSPGQ